MGILNHLIAPRRAGAMHAALAQVPLGALLLPQFERLGRAAGRLPEGGPTGSAWSRAYVLGAACASLQQPGGAPISDQTCFATALDAFTLTYGARRARAILAATIAAAEAQEPEVEDGLLQGAADLALVAAGAPGASLHFATRIVEELAEAA
ncbi:hypothetical protein [Sphingomonas sp. RIT328]|uniref:hypothetical protein n=1 Tax=Sphingomonas sp. RIT328 TaxID=1470591 RepID=UPI000445B2AF|nr:hypothetical protein [Sphingomonas sp. RIT328]EZP55317.1 hypothetical protein BW41_01055 [Sphingomonas sp. RIT328]